jgi:hypothetical protein
LQAIITDSTGCVQRFFNIAFFKDFHFLSMVRPNARIKISLQLQLYRIPVIFGFT